MPKLFVSAGIQNLENAKFYSCHINLVTVLQSTCELNAIKLFHLTYFNRILFPFEFSFFLWIAIYIYVLRCENIAKTE